MKSILVTGGAGYIGSHAARELARSGYRPISLDNLSKGHEQAVLDGDFIRGELADEELLESIFQKHSVDAVMHFAALCEVGESVELVTRRDNKASSQCFETVRMKSLEAFTAYFA